MAVQQRRTSKTRKRLRRTHFKLQVSGLVTCPNCGALIKSHHVCPKCHFYGGKLVIADAEQEQAPVKAKKAKAKKAVKEAPVAEEKVEKKTEKKPATKKPAAKKPAAKKPAAKKTTKKAEEKAE